MSTHYIDQLINVQEINLCLFCESKGTHKLLRSAWNSPYMEAGSKSWQ
jgi:hypothetical protein